MKSFETIIVGAGPAGSSCARQLARQGRSVLLLDKAAFPRPKVCGGGFSEKAYALLDFDVTPVIETAVTRAAISLRSRDTAVVERPGGAGYMVGRNSFDALLVEKAVAAGAVLREKTAFRGLQADAGGWIVRAGQNTYRGDYLVGADGVHSRVARCLGLMKQFDRYAPAVAAEIGVTDGILEARRECAAFDFHVFGKGYAWIFPKADHLSVGLFSTQFPLKGLGRKLRDYITAHADLRNGTIRTWRGGLIPRGGSRQTIVAGNALLAGDAAAMTDPFFGEGISYAIQSGLLAAETILATIRGKRQSLADYQTICRREITGDLRWARLFNLTFYRFPFLFYPAIRKSAILQNLVVDINSGRITWRDGVQKIFFALPCWVRQAILP